MKSDKRTLIALLVAALLGPFWLPFTGTGAAAGGWVMHDMGACSSGDRYRGVASGDVDRDDRPEIYFHGWGGNIYQYARTVAAWDVADLGEVLKQIEALTVGDADNDGETELYLTGFNGTDMTVCRFAKEAGKWKNTVLSAYPGQCLDIKCGDGDNDGFLESYLADSNGHVYRYSMYDGWAGEDLGVAPEFYSNGFWQAPEMCSVTVGDGDNDGRNEVYAAASDNHLYRFYWTGLRWTLTDMGTSEPFTELHRMKGIAIGDVDRNGLDEVYGFSEGYATVGRFAFDPAAGSWNVSRIGAFSPQVSGLSMAIGDIDSSGVDRIYVGLWDGQYRENRLHEGAYDILNDTWQWGLVQRHVASIYDLEICDPAPGCQEAELFAAVGDGHGYEFYNDHLPPPNPVVTSNTHREPGKWYTASGVYVCWTQPGRDISGIAGYSYTWDRNPDTIPVETLSCPATLSGKRESLPDDWGWYFHIRAVDNSGNWNRTASHYGPVCIDSTPPDSARVIINCPDEGTNRTVVSLSVIASDPLPGSGVAWMAFSNDGFSWSPWEPFDYARPGWDLADSRYGGTGAGGQKFVYVSVMDLAGNALALDDVGSGEVFIDSDAPAGLRISIDGAAGLSNSTDVTLRVYCTDPEPSSGLSGMSFSNDGVAWSNWYEWGLLKRWSLLEGAGGSGRNGNRTVWFRAKDGLGNIGGPARASIFLDTVPPALTCLTINGGAAFTNTARLELSIDASDPDPGSGVDRMALSRDGEHWADWETLVKQSVMDIETGDGTKTFFARTRDAAGNIGAAANVSIIMDTTAPMATIKPLPSSVPRPDFTVSWTGADGLSGIRYYDVQYRDRGGAWTDWIMNTDQAGAVFIGTDGTSYSFRVRARDNAGNLGSFFDVGSAWVTVGIPGPVVTIGRPEANTTVSGLYAISGSSFAADPNRTILSVEVRIDNGPWLASAGTTNWSWVLDSSALPNGKHAVRARAFDGSRYSPEVSREFTVKNDPAGTGSEAPPLSPAVRAVIAACVLGAAVVLFWKSKRRAGTGGSTRFDQKKRP